MNKELAEAVKLFISQPLNNPLSRGQIMELARLTLPILEQQERGEGEWIKWGGGEQPVNGDVMVETKWSDGLVGCGEARKWRWDHSSLFSNLNLIAYRIIPEQ